jgi:hypothetical protein
MKEVLLAAVAATIVAISPAFAGPSEEAAQDYDSWAIARRAAAAKAAAEKAAAQAHTPTPHGHIIHRSKVAR